MSETIAEEELRDFILAVAIGTLLEEAEADPDEFTSESELLKLLALTERMDDADPEIKARTVAMAGIMFREVIERIIAREAGGGEAVATDES